MLKWRRKQIAYTANNLLLLLLILQVECLFVTHMGEKAARLWRHRSDHWTLYACGEKTIPVSKALCCYLCYTPAHVLTSSWGRKRPDSGVTGVTSGPCMYACGNSAQSPVLLLVLHTSPCTEEHTCNKVSYFNTVVANLWQ